MGTSVSSKGVAGEGKTEDCMMDAMFKEPGCGWK